jgi:hypothetical protein
MKPYIFIAKNTAHMKSGAIIREGSRIEAVWDADGPVLSASIKVDGIQFEKRVSNRTILKLMNKKTPNYATLKRWESGGYCKTILDNKTEPDGRDEHGAPSWLLAMGMI